MSKVTDALNKLDPDNPNHWTADGLPRLETVKMFSGESNLTREQLTREAPDFTRANAASKGKTEDPAGTGDAVASETGTVAADNEKAGDPAVTSDANQEGTPNTGNAPKTDEQKESEGNGAGEFKPQGGTREKKPNDLQGVYTPTQGIDAEGKVVGVINNDAPSVARQPGGTAPEHIPSAATVKDMVNLETNPEEQADGTDGTSVHAKPLRPSNDGESGQKGVGADGEVGEDAIPDLEAQVKNFDQQLDDLRKQREAAVKQLDEAKTARAANQSPQTNSDTIRSWLDKQNEIRTQRGRAQQELRNRGIDTHELRKALVTQDPIDAQRARKPGFGS